MTTSPFFTWPRFFTASLATKLYSWPSGAFNVTSRVLWLIFVTVAVTSFEAITVSLAIGAAGACAPATDVRQTTPVMQAAILQDVSCFIIQSPLFFVLSERV